MSNRFEIIKRCCSWLEKVVFDRVWNEPYAEFRTNTRPRILNGMTEVSAGFSSAGVELTKKIYVPSAGVLTGNFEQIELPHTGTSFYVYAVDVGLFDTIKLRSDAWTSLADYSNKRLLDLQIYSDSGKMLYRGGSYVRQSDHADMVLLAVDAKALHTSCDYYVDGGEDDPVLERYDPSAIYLTKYFESDWEADNEVVSEQITSTTVSKIRVHRFDPVPSDATLAFYNGKVLSGRYINAFKVGEYFEYFKDKDIVADILLDRNSAQLPTYSTEKGDRVLVHIPLACNTEKHLITYNTCDVYLIPQEMDRLHTVARCNKDVEGVYVHQCERGENFHQLTFNDFSIDLDLLDKIAAECGYANKRYYIKVLVRHHHKKLGLIRDANYVDLLYSYRHKDEDILAFLTGESPYIDEYHLECWTAENLEKNSAYAQEMISRLGSAIPSEIYPEADRGRYRHVTEKFYIDGKQYYTLDSTGEYRNLTPVPGSPIDEGVYEYVNVHSYPEKSTIADEATADGSMEFRNYDRTKINTPRTGGRTEEDLRVNSYEMQCQMCGARNVCTRQITVGDKTINVGSDTCCPYLVVRKLKDYVKIFGFFQTLSLICWRVSQFRVLEDFRKRIVGFVPKYDYTQVTENATVEDGEEYFIKRFNPVRFVPYRESTATNAVEVYAASGSPSLKPIAFEDVDLSNTVYLYAYKNGDDLVYIKDITTTLDPEKEYFICKFEVETTPTVLQSGTSIPADAVYFTPVRTEFSKDVYKKVDTQAGDFIRANGTVVRGTEVIAIGEIYKGIKTEDGDPIYESENNIIHVRVPLVLSDRAASEFEVLVYVNGLKVDAEVLDDCWVGTTGLLEIYHNYTPRLADDSFDKMLQRRLCVRIDNSVELKKGDFITAEVLVKTDNDLDKFRQEFDLSQTEDLDTDDVHTYAFSIPCERNLIKTFDKNSEVLNIGGHGTEYVFLNRRLLVPTIDYLPYALSERTTVNGDLTPVAMQNVSYFDREEGNLLEAVTTSDQRIGMFTGFLKGNWIEWDGIAPFWFDNLSVLSVDGKVCANFEYKYSGIEIKDDEMENGSPYFIRTSAPVAALYAMNDGEFNVKQEMQADTITMKHIADYFNSFYANDKYRMVIPGEHKIFSRYLHALIKAMLSTTANEATKRSSNGYTPGTLKKYKLSTDRNFKSPKLYYIKRDGVFEQADVVYGTSIPQPNNTYYEETFIPQLGYFDFDLPITDVDLKIKLDQFDAQTKDVNGVKIWEKDVVFADQSSIRFDGKTSGIDLEYVDIYPTFHNLDIGSRDVRRKIAYLITRLTTVIYPINDNMRHREHIDGN